MQSNPLTPGPHPASLTPPLVGPLIPPPPSQYGTPAWEVAKAAIWSPIVAAAAGCVSTARDAPPAATQRRRAPISVVLVTTVETAATTDRLPWRRSGSMDPLSAQPHWNLSDPSRIGDLPPDLPCQQCLSNIPARPWGNQRREGLYGKMRRWQIGPKRVVAGGRVPWSGHICSSPTLDRQTSCCSAAWASESASASSTSHAGLGSPPTLRPRGTPRSRAWTQRRRWWQSL